MTRKPMTRRGFLRLGGRAALGAAALGVVGAAAFNPQDDDAYTESLAAYDAREEDMLQEQKASAAAYRESLTHDVKVKEANAREYAASQEAYRQSLTVPEIRDNIEEWATTGDVVDSARTSGYAVTLPQPTVYERNQGIVAITQDEDGTYHALDEAEVERKIATIVDRRMLEMLLEART